MPRTLMIVLGLAAAVSGSGCGKADDTKSRPAAGGGSSAASPAAALPPTDSAESEPGARQAKDTQTGMALFLADQHQGSRTFSGETFDNRKLMAAHPSYPMGTVVRVTNLRNGRAVEVIVVDRGPAQRKGAVIDLSRSAAEKLDFIGAGSTRVRLEVVEWGGGGKD